MFINTRTNETRTNEDFMNKEFEDLVHKRISSNDAFERWLNTIYSAFDIFYMESPRKTVMDLWEKHCAKEVMYDLTYGDVFPAYCLTNTNGWKYQKERN